jgi:O-antigen ligase
VLAALSVAALYSMAGIGERSTVAVESGSSLDASAQGRLLAWEAGFGMALSDPLTGVGMQNFPLCYFFFTDEWHGRHVAAHSMWFEVLGENGFVGLALFIALMSVTAGTLSRSHRRLDAAGAPVFARAMAISLVAGFYGLVVSGSFLSQAYGWPVGITMALSFAVSRYAGTFLTNADASRLSQPARPSMAPSR